MLPSFDKITERDSYDRLFDTLVKNTASKSWIIDSLRKDALLWEDSYFGKKSYFEEFKLPNSRSSNSKSHKIPHLSSARFVPNINKDDKQIPLFDDVMLVDKKNCINKTQPICHNISLVKRIPQFKCFREDLYQERKPVPHNSLTKCIQRIPSVQPKNTSLFIRNANYCDFDSESCVQTLERLILTKSEVKNLNQNADSLFFGLPNSIESSKVLHLKSILEIDASNGLDGSKKSKRRFMCKYCGVTFDSGCALGGHTSKVHKGVSIDYSRKQIARLGMKTERERSKFFNMIISQKE